MKAFLLALLVPAALAAAQSQPLIYQPSVRQYSVTSPLTPSSAQSNQALLNQINSTLQQRAFEHQVLTLQTAPAYQVPVVQPGRVIIDK